MERKIVVFKAEIESFKRKNLSQKKHASVTAVDVTTSSTSLKFNEKDNEIIKMPVYGSCHIPDQF